MKLPSETLIEKIDKRFENEILARESWMILHIVRNMILNEMSKSEKDHIIDAYCECWANVGGNKEGMIQEAELYFKTKYKLK